MLMLKFPGASAARNSKSAHVRCGSVPIEKLLCEEFAGVPELTAHKYSEFLSPLESKSLYTFMDEVQVQSMK